MPAYIFVIAVDIIINSSKKFSFKNLLSTALSVSAFLNTELWDQVADFMLLSAFQALILNISPCLVLVSYVNIIFY